MLTISSILFFCDHRFHCFNNFRYHVSPIVLSIQYVINRPSELLHVFAANFASKQTVLEENKQLNAEILLTNARLQRLDFLEHENSELRTLIHCSKQIKGKMLFAEIIKLTTDKFIQQITIDKGKQQGVYIGQPVLDAYGLLGQVVMVESTVSTVMLVTNSKSAVPVVVVRNGLRSIALGTGRGEYLELANVPETADIKVGDLLVTSGLGRVFPAGYQVGIVKDIKKVFGERFMNVVVSPKAHVYSDLYVLLVGGA